MSADNGDDAPQNWPWDVLGMDAPGDDRAVRRAYAKQLKAINPEADPAKFEALRAAYQFARHLAAHQDDEGDEAQEATMDGGAPPPEPAAIAAPEPQAETPPPEVPPPQPARAPWADAPEPPRPAADPDAVDRRAFEAALAEMRTLLERGNYALDDWRHLLARPVLEDMRYSAEFEAELVGKLEACELALQPFRTRLKAPVDWVAMIENRYGWVADGLRFQDLFPGHMRLRQVFADTYRPATSPRPAPQDQPPPLPPIKDEARSGSSRVGLIIFAMIMLVQYVRHIGWFMDMLGQIPALLLFTLIPALVVHTLAERPQAKRAARGFGIAMICTVVVGAWLSSSLGADRLNEYEIDQQWRKTALRERFSDIGPRRELLQARSVPGYGLSAGAIDEILSGDRPLDSSIIARIGLNYPEIALETPLNRRDEIEEAATSTQRILERRLQPAGSGVPEFTRVLSCARNGRCRLLLEAALRIEVRAAPAHVVMDRPVIVLDWQRGKPDSLSGSPVAPASVLALPLTPAMLAQRDALGPRGSYVFYDGIPLEVLKSTILVGGAPSRLTLSVSPASVPGAPLVINRCAEEILAPGWSIVVDDNPNRDTLLQELCSLSADNMPLTYLGCSPVPGNPQVLCDFARDGSFRNATTLDPATAPWTEDFDTPVDLLLTAEIRGAAPVFTAAIGTVSDQIILDYLTIFWDVPPPPELAAYLARNPQIIRPGQKPERELLVAAAARQPHLARLYPHRTRIGALVLADMLLYLREMGMLRP